MTFAQYNPIYQVIFNSYPNSVFVLDDRIKVISSNDTARTMFGDDLVGKYILDIIEGDNLSTSLASVISTEKSASAAVTAVESISTKFTASIQRMVINDVVLVLVVLTDSNNLTIEPKLADFIANAGHEIRTPITSLLAMIETLIAEKWENRETINLFSPILLNQTMRLKSLVNDLLSLSKMSIKSSNLPQYTVNLVEVIEVLSLQLAKTLEEYKLDLIIKKDKDVFIQGDFHELSLMYHNIISNAIRHSDPKSKIIVEIGYTKDFPVDNKYLQDYQSAAYVSITDEGDGIPHEHIHRLTEEFYKVDRGRSKGGFGLGLSVAQQVLSRHNGVLDIQSNIGRGSVFSTYFGLNEDVK